MGDGFLAGRARLARAENARELLARIPEVLDVLRCHVEELRAGRVPLEVLVITRTLSKEPGQYVREDAGAVAAKALARAGVKLHPGERIGYVILNAKAKVKEERSRPAICLRGDESYDKERYVALLQRAAETLLVPPNRILLGYRYSGVRGTQRRRD